MTPHCDLFLFGITMLPLTILVDRNLVTGIKDSKVISKVNREHDLIHRMWDQQPVGVHRRWDHGLPEDCYQHPVCTMKRRISQCKC